ncbi:hypothetical protein [Mesorhizobium sp. M1142]
MVKTAGMLRYNFINNIAGGEKTIWNAGKRWRNDDLFNKIFQAAKFGA